jgi:hypothetical protein
VKRLLGAIIAATMVSGVVFASAAVLPGVDGSVLQYGEDVNLTCQTTALQVRWQLETDTNQVSAVKLTPFDSACNDARLWIRVTGTAGTLAYSGQQTISGPDFFYTFTSPLNPADITDIHVWVQKP